MYTHSKTTIYISLRAQVAKGTVFMKSPVFTSLITFFMNPFFSRATDKASSFLLLVTCVILGLEALLFSGLDNKECNKTYLYIVWLTGYNKGDHTILHSVYILLLQRTSTLVPVLSDNTWPSLDVGQRRSQLVGWPRSGRKQRINKLYLVVSCGLNPQGPDTFAKRRPKMGGGAFSR